MILDIEFLHKRNSVGPRTDPCGTLHLIALREPIQSPINTYILFSRIILEPYSYMNIISKKKFKLKAESQSAQFSYESTSMN